MGRRLRRGVQNSSSCRMSILGQRWGREEGVNGWWRVRLKMRVMCPVRGVKMSRRIGLGGSFTCSPGIPPPPPAQDFFLRALRCLASPHPHLQGWCGASHTGLLNRPHPSDVGFTYLGSQTPQYVKVHDQHTPHSELTSKSAIC